MRTKTNVRGYTDKEIFDRLEYLDSTGELKFKRTFGLPLIINIQSKEDAFNVFDDKSYLYTPSNDFVMVTSITTNAGKTGLFSFDRYNSKGVAVLKTDVFYPRGYKYGLHRGGMEALRQNVPFLHYRDGNKNKRAEEIGKLYNEIIWANYHGVDYNKLSVKLQMFINGWSLVCQTCNDMIDYRKIIAYVKPFKEVDFALLKEW